MTEVLFCWVGVSVGWEVVCKFGLEVEEFFSIEFRGVFIEAGVVVGGEGRILGLDEGVEVTGVFGGGEVWDL